MCRPIKINLRKVYAVLLVSLLKTGGRGHVFNIEESRENHAKCWEQNRRMILIKLTGARWTGLKN